ncbi:hypothetical protein ACFVGM_02265 [Kitasatospora purpeofusca]|uniref:hypothetical protein n=1 Tax=Kitasatospora purpeofusca TaxID=67352 RepID=UPI0036A4DA49
MRSLLTADDVFAHVLMLSAVSKKLFILVEGDSDCAVIDPHLDTAVCDTLPSGGTVANLGAIEIARSQNLDSVAAVSDLDWADVLYPRQTNQNVFYVDFYDIDALVFSRKQNVRSVVANFTVRSTMRDHMRAIGETDAVDIISRIAFPIGVLRCLSEKHSWGLATRKFPIHLVLDDSKIQVDLPKLASLAVSRSKGAAITASEIIPILEAEIHSITDPYRYCSGHDLINALSVVAREKWNGKAGGDTLAAAIRSAFNCSDAQSSALFSAIRKWGEGNGSDVLSCT